MGERWFEALRPACKEACLAVESCYATDVVLFYVARWCQKTSDSPAPSTETLAQDELEDVPIRIVGNLEDDGSRVDLLVEGDAEEWTALRRVLIASAGPRVGRAAGDYADEGLSNIAIVLLTGTPPSRAAEALARGPHGPSNEYVFSSPFPYWAKTIVINLIKDDKKKEKRELEGPKIHAPKHTPQLDPSKLREACDALPGLLDAIRELPPVQRSVLISTLSRRGLDGLVLDRLHELAPDMFGETELGTVSTDADMAERLGTTSRLVAANRSVARRKLAKRDRAWALLLDVLLPHRSTRPLEGDHG